MSSPTDVERKDSAEGSGTSVEDTFIQRWGDMGAVWGINRTMAEVQGLLYITGRQWCMDEIMARLDISRGSASTALRSLVDWGIVRKHHRRGERREYYESLEDVWEIFARVAQQRKRKEIDPILVTLRECHEVLVREESATPDAEGRGTDPVRVRLDNMLRFLSTMESLARRFSVSEGGLARVIGLLSSLE